MRDLWTEVNITGPKWFAWSRLSSLGPMSHCTPYALHGDAVPVLKGKSLYVVTGCSLLGSGTSIDVKMLRACYWSHMKNKSPENLGCDTEDKVWKYIQWDLETLFSGKANHWQVVSFSYLGL